MVKVLTPDFILMRCKTDKLTQIKNLNLWGNDLEDVSALRDLPNMEICSLSLNKISSLRDFQSSKKLKELYLRKNQIADLQELKYLGGLPNLKVLWLWDNPICQHPLYRQYCIKLLPNLVKLDSTAVSSEERQSCAQMAITDADLQPTAQQRAA